MNSTIQQIQWLHSIHSNVEWTKPHGFFSYQLDVAMFPLWNMQWLKFLLKTQMNQIKYWRRFNKTVLLRIEEKKMSQSKMSHWICFVWKLLQLKLLSLVLSWILFQLKRRTLAAFSRWFSWKFIDFYNNHRIHCSTRKVSCFFFSRFYGWSNNWNNILHEMSW